MIMNSKSKFINVIFNDALQKINIIFKRGTKIKDIIEGYFKRIQKTNLLVNNIDNILFLFNIYKLNNEIDKTLESLIGNCDLYVITVLNGRDNDDNYEIINTIKENVFSSVFKAKKKNKNENISKQNEIKPPNNSSFPNEYVAIKKIYKDKIKQEMKFAMFKDEITEEDFKPEIIKFNKELKNMQMCQCENSVDIYDYYDGEKEFTIIMELCDETLFHLLCRRPKGFSSEEIKEILVQLNNVFKRMKQYGISHRDIKLNNILVKYLNPEKTKFKVLLSDYGISNQLYSLTQKFTTHAGSQLIMAPEILNDEDYTNKCDLWSLGVIIFQLYTKAFPYKGTVEKAILKQIEQKGQSVLNVIDEKDQKLKDLLSQLLVRDPKQRIAWENYFRHPFFD